MEKWVAVVIAGIGLLVTIIVQSIHATAALAKARKEIHDDAESRQKHLLERLDRETRMVGETVGAIKQTVADVRLHGAETYQRRDTFHQQMTALNIAMNARFEKIEEAMDNRFCKLEDKIDKIIERVTRGD